MMGSSDTSFVKLKTIEFNNPFFKGIFTQTNEKLDLPKIAFRYSSQPSIKSSAETILQFDNGGSFLSKTKTSKGDVWLFTSPFSEEKNQFKNHALFVPIMLRIAELSSNKQALYFTIGDASKVLLPASQSSENISVEMTNENSSKKFIPKYQQNGKNIAIEMTNDIDNSGFWMLNQSAYSTSLAFNFNRKESSQNYYSQQELLDIVNSSQSSNIKLFDIDTTTDLNKIIKGEIGQSLWGYFIFASLLFFLIEILLIRFLK